MHTLVAPAAPWPPAAPALPAVLTFHTGGSSSGLRERLRPLQFAVIGPLMRSAAALVAVCEFERRMFARILGIPADTIRLIRNGSEPLPVDPAAPGIAGAPLLVSGRPASRSTRGTTA